VTQARLLGDRQRSADILDVKLDQNFVTLGCPPGCRSRSGECGHPESVKVQAKISGTADGTPEFLYKPSQGKIVGSGSEVVWDLSNTPPGALSLTVKANHAKSKTVYVTVRECPDCICDIFCPTLTVNGPVDTVQAGTVTEFVADGSGGDSVAFSWKVKGGKIVSGNHTNNIRVKVSRKHRGRLIATVHIESENLRKGNCTQSASAEVNVRPAQ